jgi:hypothetical protein
MGTEHHCNCRGYSSRDLASDYEFGVWEVRHDIYQIREGGVYSSTIPERGQQVHVRVSLTRRNDA